MTTDVKRFGFASARWIAALLVVLAAAGCSNKLGATHQQNVNAAEGRWRSARSGLMLGMAQRQFDTGDLDAAEKTLREAVAMDPSNPRLHLLGGRIAIERGKLEQAAGLFKLAIEFDPELTEAHYYQGLVFQRWLQYDKALASYQRAYELQRDNPAFLIAASEMLVALDRWEEAAQQLKDKLTYFDQNAGIRAALGQIYLIRNQFGLAVHYFREAATLRPDDLQLVERLITAQIGAGDIDKATRELERLLQAPEYAQRRDLRRTLAECYHQQRRLDDAKQVYLKLTRTDPTDEQTWVRLGEIALEMEDWSGALLASNRVMALAPRRFEGPLIAGLVAQKRGQLDRALDHFERAATLAPGNTMPLILRGLALESAGRIDEAAAAYKEALARQPDDEQARQLLANVERSH